MVRIRGLFDSIIGHHAEIAQLVEQFTRNE